MFKYFGMENTERILKLMLGNYIWDVKILIDLSAKNFLKN
jgi:hypothetical protein